MDDTRYIKKIWDAQKEYRLMKSDLEKVMNIIQPAGQRNVVTWEPLSGYMARLA